MATCTDIISTAKAAIAARDKQLDAAHKTAQDATQYNAMLQQTNVQLTDSLHAWYHNPVVMGALGMVLGGVVIGLARK